MADVVVVGAGLGGLSTAMLLAGDGHHVTVVERDGEGPPADPDEAWEGWQRRGVNQFRMLHFLLPRWQQLAAVELPAVTDELERRGALRFNVITSAPDEVTGGQQPGDDRFVSLTARRPVIESAVATAAEATPGVTVRRGVAIAGLVCGTPAADGVPHVIGIRTEAGEEIRADLVVDAAGRRSSLPRWLADVGARAPREELEDCGFVYYGRHFRARNGGGVPPSMGPLLQHYGTLSILTLPADNGTWGVGVITSAHDTPMRGLRDPLRWEAVVSSHPLVAHWLDGEPLDDEVAVMAKIEDRWRRYTVDGRPVATGVVAVGDSWACTNPSLGRGITIGLLHALALRQVMRDHPLDDPLGFAGAFDDVTVRDIEPWYRSTLSFDRHRLAEIDAMANGEAYEPDDPSWALIKALDTALMHDPELLRGFGDIASLNALPEEVFARPGLFDRVIELGAGWRDAPVLGPARSELLATVGA
jgi:2-polyprenyl-6-methoxyphenol hydroxylase-like FAD-dependent oxidoreductase